MTFAYYIPSDYSEEKFKRKELDYGRHLSPIAIWGTPANVAAGIDAHNNVVRNLASNRKGVIFFDQQEAMPKNGKVFDDSCHFSEQGARRFVENVIQPICDYWRRVGKLRP